MPEPKPGESTLQSKLEAFRDELNVFNVGALGTALILTRKAKTSGLPLDPDKLATPGGGQVAGLSGSAINKILKEHGEARIVGTESGRTSRGTISLANSYAELLNGLALREEQIAEVEKWWVARFVDYFNTEPFDLNHDSSKTLKSVIQNILDRSTVFRCRLRPLGRFRDR